MPTRLCNELVVSGHCDVIKCSPLFSKKKLLDPTLTDLAAQITSESLLRLVGSDLKSYHHHMKSGYRGDLLD
jgi:hypothetical protein